MSRYVYFRLNDSSQELKAYTEYCHQRGWDAASKTSKEEKRIISKAAIDDMAIDDWETNQQEIESLVDDPRVAKEIWLTEWIAGYFSNIFAK